MSKKLFIVETISSFKNTYVIEADELEHAFDEVTMVDSGSPDDVFDAAEQVYLGETIIGGRGIKMKHFKQLLKDTEVAGTGSPWMGEKLIRKLDYDK